MRKSMLTAACTVLLLTGCPDDHKTASAPAVSAEASSTVAEEQSRRFFVSVRGRGPRAEASAPPVLLAAAAAPSTASSSPAPGVVMHTGGPLPALQVPDPPFLSEAIATFNEPWAMTFLPDGRLLVTEKGGRLKLLNVASRQVGDVAGVPMVAYGGQGGLGDVALHPQFASNRLVYLSFVEQGANNTRGAAVVRGELALDTNGGGSLANLQMIWRQVPKVTGFAHYSHRIAFDGGGKLWISSGDRQLLDPAQEMQSNLGKMLRLNSDGSIPADNPFASQGGVTAQIWSLGHRNVLGLAFDAQGRLWQHEMGPMGGDELNLIERASNYGWPIVSNGSHYDGSNIPDHHTRPEFNAPEAWWTPVIAPSGFIIYSGDLFPYFRGLGFIGGLASQALVVVEFHGSQARESARYDMGRRIREVEQGPDGAIWLLEDGGGARLLRLRPNGPI